MVLFCSVIWFVCSIILPLHSMNLFNFRSFHDTSRSFHYKKIQKSIISLISSTISFVPWLCFRSFIYSSSLFYTLFRRSFHDYVFVRSSVDPSPLPYSFVPWFHSNIPCFRSCNPLFGSKIMFVCSMTMISVVHRSIPRRFRVFRVIACSGLVVQTVLELSLIHIWRCRRRG